MDRLAPARDTRLPLPGEAVPRASTRGGGAAGPPPANAGALGRFQDDFARALFASGIGAERDSGALGALVRQPGFAVYRNTVHKDCIDALAANYPTVARLTGEAWFRAAAAVYVRANPPRQPMLVTYGEGFARFLAAFEPAAGLPYLPGVARLDRLWTEAHVARDAAPLAAAELAGLDTHRLARRVLRVHPAARWAWFDGMPVFTIWQRNRAPGAVDATEIPWRGEGALVVRPHDAVRWLGLEAAGCAFLDACARGYTVAAAGAAALAVHADADLAEMTARLLAVGALASSDKEEGA